MDSCRLDRHASIGCALCLHLGSSAAIIGKLFTSHVDDILAKEKETFSQITLAAMEAALLSGEILQSGFGTSFAISKKKGGQHNLVTEYDHKSEAAIIEFLSNQIPSSHFLAEESGSSGFPSHDIHWIIDPLDGTMNFAHQVPLFSVSIAAMKNKEVCSAVVYQPMTHELFVAEKNRGAFLNGHKLQVSKENQLEQAFLATGFPYNLSENPFHCIDHFVDLLRLGIPIRRIGSAAIDLAYTAAGRFEGYFEVGLGPWDVAAGSLLIHEAGGEITHWDGKPFDLFAKKTLLASNGHLHQKLRSCLERK